MMTMSRRCSNEHRFGVIDDDILGGAIDDIMGGVIDDIMGGVNSLGDKGMCEILMI